MLIKQIYVVPTGDTLLYLHRLFKGNFIDWKPEHFRLRLLNLRTDTDVKLDPNRVYSARTVGIVQDYDPNLNTSPLILTLDSPELLGRVQEFGDEGIGDVFYDTFNPYVVMLKRPPPRNDSVRRAILSVNNVFGTGVDLEFTGEHIHIEDMDEQWPPEFEYNRRMDARADGSSQTWQSM